MKKKSIFLFGIFFIMLIAACTQPAGDSEHASGTTPTASPDAETIEKPFVLTLTRPKIGAFGYVQTEYINETEFYPESKTRNRPNIFHIEKEPIKVVKKMENGTIVYWVDDEPYICIKKELTDTEAETWPENYYYDWSYDRRFFYKYADTSSGETLYRNQNTDSLEVLILTNTEWEYLLVRRDSPYANAETMCIDDFGLMIIEGVLFARAKDFELLFYANTRGVDQNTVFTTDEADDVLDLYGWNYGWNLTFECTRVPGLRYTFHAMPSDDNMKTYVNSRAENKRVMIYGSTILPVDELIEALNRETEGVYYGTQD